MEKIYDPKTIESHWTSFWGKEGFFKADIHSSKPTYTIMLPPPNVTGRLHMGHGFQQTLMDALIRYHHMLGNNTLWQSGTDHAGISTQMVVERQLLSEGKSRHDLGRETFVKKVWEWKELSGSHITKQMCRLGVSVDWERTRFSMDEQISKATRAAFIHLYKEGLIYRGKKLVNWDPALQTAISDLEVATEEEKGLLWYIRYPIVNSQEYLVIATTRPETMLGDTAVAIHPEDERYQHLIGKKIKLPLTDREIPIIADEMVDKEFGTGCVKITPAHDFNDYEVGVRHNLKFINILTETAKLNENAPKVYQGLDRFEARKKILEDLEAQHLLEKTKDYTLQIPRGDRSGEIIEPLLTDQWFIKVEPLAKKAIKVVENGKLKFVPNTWTKVYLQWLYNIHDWCISRQLWWGHRIPAWYDDKGNVYVGDTEEEVRQKHKLNQSVSLTQDSDVLDTWFTASLWPFSSLGWPEKTPELKLFYPSNVLITGFDIIFFWVARMVMMGLHFLDDIPFSEVYMTGLIRDTHGQKMSKTKGNVLDPIDLIDGISLKNLLIKRTEGLMQPQMRKAVEKQTKKDFPKGIPAFGTDALRFTFCALANTGRNISFDMGRIEGYRYFCNKLWNAARFVLINIEGHEITDKYSDHANMVDIWISCQLDKTIEKIDSAFKEYRFDLLAQLLYDFTWHEYCDWYLEFAKCTLNDEKSTEEQKSIARYTLVFILEKLLCLMHPVMPFITEEIWQKVAPLLDIKGKSIMLEQYPQADGKRSNDSGGKEIKWLKRIITTIRNIRSEANISPAKKIAVLLNKGGKQDPLYLDRNKLYIQTLARVDSIDWAKDKLPLSATALVGSLEIHVPLEGLIDIHAEITRLDKEIKKLEKELQKCNQKLDNPSYIEKAPREIVAKELVRQNEIASQLETLQKQKEKLQNK